MKLHVVVMLALLAACGPSRTEIRAANDSVYQTEFANVWNAVVTTVQAQYPRLAIEDAVGGRLVTDWHLVERVSPEELERSGTPSGPGGQPAVGTGAQNITGVQNLGAGKFFRIAVIIRKGGPPWRIEIDGEAALYKPGDALLIPYDHDDADEPSWVKPRIEKVKVGVYRKLKASARRVEAKQKKQFKQDTAAWQNLPDEAVPVVAGVRAAADKKDVDALRPHMTDDFVWSLGGQPSLPSALAYWDADPLILSKLRVTLDAGCKHDETDHVIVCPVTGDAPGSWRAEFRLVGKAWRFAAFYLNE